MPGRTEKENDKMKRYVLAFIQRGLLVMGWGPICMAVVYLILWKCGVVATVATGEMVLGILTVSLMTFFAGGIGVVYQIERLPLLYAFLIHFVTLYLDYVVIYLINGWLADGIIPFLIFTAIFIAGFLLIWCVVYFITRANVRKMNESMEGRGKVVERSQKGRGKVAERSRGSASRSA
jgi:hypothetical protein